MTDTEMLLTLMHDAKQLYARSFEPLAKAHGVNRLETEILLFLHNNPDFDTAQQICDLRGLRKSNVSAAVARLCARGWLDRRRDAKNRRSVRLTLTRAARPFVLQAAEIQRGAFESLARALSPEELETARLIAGKIRDRVARLLSKQEEERL